MAWTAVSTLPWAVSSSASASGCSSLSLASSSMPLMPGRCRSSRATSKRRLGRRGQRLLAAGRGGDGHAEPLEAGGQGAAQFLVVIDDEQAADVGGLVCSWWLPGQGTTKV